MTEKTPFEKKAECLAVVLDQFPPMQLMRAVEILAEDESSRLSNVDLAVAASNVAPVEVMEDLAKSGEDQ